MDILEEVDGRERSDMRLSNASYSKSKLSRKKNKIPKCPEIERLYMFGSLEQSLEDPGCPECLLDVTKYSERERRKRKRADGSTMPSQLHTRSPPMLLADSAILE